MNKLIILSSCINGQLLNQLVFLIVLTLILLVVLQRYCYKLSQVQICNLLILVFTSVLLTVYSIITSENYQNFLIIYQEVMMPKFFVFFTITTFLANFKLYNLYKLGNNFGIFFILLSDFVVTFMIYLNSNKLLENLNYFLVNWFEYVFYLIVFLLVIYILAIFLIVSNLSFKKYVIILEHSWLFYFKDLGVVLIKMLLEYDNGLMATQWEKDKKLLKIAAANTLVVIILIYNLWWHILFAMMSFCFFVEFQSLRVAEKLESNPNYNLAFKTKTIRLMRIYDVATLGKPNQKNFSLFKRNMSKYEFLYNTNARTFKMLWSNPSNKALYVIGGTAAVAGCMVGGIYVYSENQRTVRFFHEQAQINFRHHEEQMTLRHHEDQMTLRHHEDQITLRERERQQHELQMLKNSSVFSRIFKK